MNQTPAKEVLTPTNSVRTPNQIKPTKRWDILMEDVPFLQRVRRCWVEEEVSLTAMTKRFNVPKAAIIEICAGLTKYGAVQLTGKAERKNRNRLRKLAKLKR